MNPSAALAGVLVDELVRGGVREAVLSPGSRSAPLAYALHAADTAGRLRLHVRVDERSAGFLALGLAKVSQLPVPVVCTSGTAAANLHPAVLEADQAGVPLFVLTADRPVELWGTGANQTTAQLGLYARAVRDSWLLTTGDGGAVEAATWRALTCRALATAAGELDGDPGPVHVDVALREPLVPHTGVGADRTDEALLGRADGGPWTRVSVEPPSWAGPFDGTRALGSSWSRTLVLLGDCPPEMARDAGRLAGARGWPVVAEPYAWSGAAVPHAVLLLGAPDWLAEHRPERVLVVGRPTLTREVQRLLADPQVAVEMVTATPRWADPPRWARVVHHRGWLQAALREPTAAPRGSWTMGGVPEPAPADEEWARAWAGAARAVSAAIGDVLEGVWPSGPRLARDLVAALPPDALLVLGSSSAVRDVDLAATPRGDLHVLANRGVAGIDGTVSTAVGAALGAQRDARARPTGVPAYALLGDLTFLHDANGLILGPDEPRPDLCLVVLDDDGGGIFGLLEQGAPEHAAPFERVLGTPHGTDLAALCAATGTPYREVTDAAELAAALAPGSGLRVLRITTDRSATRALHERLRTAVTAALSSAGEDA